MLIRHSCSEDSVEMLIRYKSSIWPYIETIINWCIIIFMHAHTRKTYGLLMHFEQLARKESPNFEEQFVQKLQDRSGLWPINAGPRKEPYNCSNLSITTLQIILKILPQKASSAGTWTHNIFFLGSNHNSHWSRWKLVKNGQDIHEKGGGFGAPDPWTNYDELWRIAVSMWNQKRKGEFDTTESLGCRLVSTYFYSVYSIYIYMSGNVSSRYHAYSAGWCPIWHN